jgi:hypothetical protein
VEPKRFDGRAKAEVTHPDGGHHVERCMNLDIDVKPGVLQAEIDAVLLRN